MTFHTEKGFTLVEVLFVVALLAILGTMTLTTVSENVDAIRYTETRAKMDAIRAAILGEDSVDALGHRTRFGFVGDMGNFPVTLSSLTTQGSQPTWTFDTFYGFGSGWRGPYVQQQFTTNLAVDLDAWGTSFVYTTSPVPSVTSLGADRAPGGVIYDKDLAMTISTNLWLSTVQGVVADGPMRVGTAAVELRYPVQGTQVAVFNTSTASGAFLFNTVPYGIRSLRVVGPSPVPALGPARVIVDRQFTPVPEHTLNFAGNNKVTLASAGAVTVTVTVNLTSAYRGTMTLDHFILSHSSANTLSSINVNAQGVETLPAFASGAKIKPRTAYTITPGANQIIFVFSATMVTNNYHLTLVFTTPGRRDTITFTT